jgi:multiple sugar transport system substrate-binding protein
MNSTGLRLLTLCTASALVLTGCAAQPSADTDSVEITFSSYNYGTAGAAGEGTQALLDAFAAAHPDITVVPQAVPVADILTKTKTDVAAGSAPDVVQLGYSKLNEAEKTLPLQSLEKIAGTAWNTHVDGIAPGLLEAGRWEGEIRAMPYTVSVPALFYNADLFAAAGLDPENPPTSIDQVASAARAISATGAFGVYFAAADVGKSDYLSQSILNSAGTPIVDSSGAITIDGKAAVTAFEKVQALTEEGLQPAVMPDDALAAFTTGKLGMFIGTTAYAPALQAGSAGTFTLLSSGFPTFGEKAAAPTHSGAGLVVLSTDEKKQQAAWEFISFLTSAEGATIITEQLGYLPLRADIVTDPAYLAGYFAQNPLLLPSLEQLNTVAPYRRFPVAKSNQATVLFQEEAVEPIILRGADASQTLTDVAKRIRALG